MVINIDWPLHFFDIPSSVKRPAKSSPGSAKGSLLEPYMVPSHRPLEHWLQSAKSPSLLIDLKHNMLSQSVGKLAHKFNNQSAFWDCSTGGFFKFSLPSISARLPFNSISKRGRCLGVGVASSHLLLNLFEKSAVPTGILFRQTTLKSWHSFHFNHVGRNVPGLFVHCWPFCNLAFTLDNMNPYLVWLTGA